MKISDFWGHTGNLGRGQEVGDLDAIQPTSGKDLDILHCRYSKAMRFIWDDNKRQSNLAKHGFDFADAETVFTGATFTYEDDRFAYREQRFVTLGVLDQILVAIAHTEANNEIRVISMRRGTKREQLIFFQNLSN